MLSYRSPVFAIAEVKMSGAQCLGRGTRTVGDAAPSARITYRSSTLRHAGPLAVDLTMSCGVGLLPRISGGDSV